MAIRQLLYLQEAIQQQTRDKRLKAARAKFDKTVPQAKNFRDFLEHLNEYLLNRGRLQKKGQVDQDPSMDVAYLGTDDQVILHFGQLHLELHTATKAALELAEVAGVAWFERMIEATRDGPGII